MVFTLKAIYKSIVKPSNLFKYTSKIHNRSQFLNYKIFICQPARQMDRLITTIDLLPKLLDFRLPFFLRVKIVTVHLNLS